MKLRLVRIIAIVLLAVAGFTIIGLLELFGRTPESLQTPVPNDAKWVLRVDAATLLKEEAFTVLFEEQDEQLLKTLRTFAENSVGSDKRPKLFINIFSEMAVFGTEVRGHSFTGILLQLENAELFGKNVPQYLKPNQTFAIEGNTALILTKTDNGILAREIQTEISKSLLKNSSVSYAAASEKSEKEYLNFVVNDPKRKLSQANIGLFLEKSNVRVDGNLKINGELKLPSFDVKHENFYFSSAFVPEDLPKTIFSGMQLGNLNFPPLENLTFSYDGIVIENGSSMFRLPKINAVLSTKTPVSINDILSQAPAEFRLDNNKLKFSNTVYHLIQLNENTIFFGTDPGTILRKSPESPLIVNGDLKKLAAVEADGMIMTGISILVPQYNAFNSFTKATEKADLKLIPTGKNYKLSGNLRFKDETSALGVITRLLLGVQSGN